MNLFRKEARASHHQEISSGGFWFIRKNHLRLLGRSCSAMHVIIFIYILKRKLTHRDVNSPAKVKAVAQLPGLKSVQDLTKVSLFPSNLNASLVILKPEEPVNQFNATLNLKVFLLFSWFFLASNLQYLPTLHAVLINVWIWPLQWVYIYIYI